MAPESRDETNSPWEGVDTEVPQLGEKFMDECADVFQRLASSGDVRDGAAVLGGHDEFTTFTCGDATLTFRTSPGLVRYERVKEWATAAS